MSKYINKDSTMTVRLARKTKNGVVLDENNFYSSADPDSIEEPINRKVSLATVEMYAVETAVKGITIRKSTI